MTQRMQNGGILYDAACNLYAKTKSEQRSKKAQARKEFAWAVSSQLVSAAVLSTMTFLARGLLHKIKNRIWTMRTNSLLRVLSQSGLMVYWGHFQEVL